jgi:hypothetical protein
MKNNTYLKQSLLLLFTVVNVTFISAQIEKSDWKFSKKQEIKLNSKSLVNKKLPSNFSVFEMSINDFKNKLNANNKFQEITIPAPNGEFETFIINPSSVVADEVAHLYTIKTFRGYKKNDPSTLIACDISDSGFHASVFTEDKSYFIEPVYKNSPETLMVFYKKHSATEGFNCKTNIVNTEKRINDLDLMRSPSTKRTYRLAVMASNNYRLQFGGNPYNEVNVLNALASGTNMVNAVYLRDLGVEFTLVNNNALIQNNNNTNNLTNRINNAIGVGAYDVGHLVLWGEENGLAGFKVVCGNNKGDGFSSSSLGVSTLWVDYVAHELGHQFGSEHNQSGCNSVDNFRYEPGEGSSIMSYANVCQGAEQYAQNSDPFFHYASIAQMLAELSSYNCSSNDATGNASDPVADAKANFTIPKETPFIVVGDGMDNNDPNNNLTYQWVQYDGGGNVVFDSPECNVNNNALFRFRSATTEKFRSLPQYSDVLAGNNDQEWEKLPCTARTMNFSLTVRDNNTAFGRLDEDRTVITVANTGPFNVVSPNGGENYNADSSQIVTWTVNNTDSHCNNVDILVSTDGGVTYTVIADATPNDGSESITMPNVQTSTARVLVRCDVSGGFRAESTFYDVSNANFSLQESLSVEEFLEFDISIFPNPASDIINVTMSVDNEFRYKLYSITGKVIYDNTINGSSVIDTSALANGLYLLELEDIKTNKSVTKKIVVKH